MSPSLIAHTPQANIEASAWKEAIGAVSMTFGMGMGFSQAHTFMHMRMGHPGLRTGRPGHPGLRTGRPRQSRDHEGRTTGRVFDGGVAARLSFPGASPARETATVLPGGTDSPPDSLGLVPLRRRTTLRRTCSNSLQQEVADARSAAMSLTSLLTEKG